MASQEFQGEEPQASPSTDVDTSTHGPRHSLWRAGAQDDNVPNG
jgi:hypothetical protein